MKRIIQLVLFLSLFSALLEQAKGSADPSKIEQYGSTININTVRWIDSERAISLSSDPKIYLTKNHGKTWEDQTSRMPGCGQNGNFPAFLYPHSADPTKIYVRGNGTLSWHSYDKGDTWESVTPDRRYINLEWHPFSPEFAIARDGNDLYVTKDFGTSWQLVFRNIYNGQYDWGDAGEGSVSYSRIYAVINSNDVPSLVATEDYGNSHTILLSHCIAFLFLDKQIFGLVEPKANEYHLQVSPDIGLSGKKNFYKAQFPFGDSLENLVYSILDDSTGAVFMGILHSAENGRYYDNLYVSDSIGYRYITSFQHIVRNYTLYDFEKVSGLDGIYLTNKLENWQDSNPQLVKKQTYFTFNNGGEWFETDPPRSSQNDCPAGQRCKLNLHGYSSLVTGYFGPFYTSPNAKGLILATGNVGEYLSTDPAKINTYISNNAGFTWKKVRTGSSIYEFADHGGIILMADYGKPTNQLYFSFDFGTTVDQIALQIGEITVSNIVSEPSSTGEKFLVLGNRGADSVVIAVDFSNVFDRVCDPVNDYEIWSPSDHREDLHGEACLLGRTVTYRRRKSTSLCFNNEAIEQVESVTPCTCVRSDYECDIDYYLQNDGATCALQGKNPIYPPEECPPGTFYSKTQGYRLIANDSCVGGLNLNPQGSYPCPDPEDIKNGWLAVVIVLPLVCCCLIVALVVARTPKIQTKIPFLSVFGTWKSGYLASRPQTLMDDEDEFTVGVPDEPFSMNDSQDEPEKKESEKKEPEKKESETQSQPTNENNDDFNPRA